VKLSIRAELIYEPTEIIVSVHAATSWDQTIVSERLSVAPSIDIKFDQPDERGERRFRAALQGEATFLYEAEVDNGLRVDLPAHALQHPWRELPQEVLQYLTASRYCPSDKFVRFATREFGNLPPGGARVHALLEWIFMHVDYVGGVSTAETTAERTFVDRAGVCRDFSHLGITLCRALNIPARAVSAYAWRLEPPDFHAVFEVFLDNAWWLVDPTRLAPVQGLVRVGTGRDAADIAFLTTSEVCNGISQCVSVTAIT